MSIWATNGGTGTDTVATNAFSQLIYGERFDEVFRFGMRFYLILIYGGGVLGTLALFRRRIDTMLILPLAILGGVLYHLISEAQSRYTLNYLPLFAPLAAYGILAFGTGLKRLFVKEKATTAEKPG
jgi:hypothetical protein